MYAADVKWIVGLVASVLTALAAQADTFPPSWKPTLTILGIVATAITGYRITPHDAVKR